MMLSRLNLKHCCWACLCDTVLLQASLDHGVCIIVVLQQLQQNNCACVYLVNEE